MRRTDREVTNPDQLFDIVSRCSVAHVAMLDHGAPYVVALNFGFERDGDALILYFHSAQEGKKIDLLHADPSVYVQMDCVDELITGTSENPCAYCWRYDSVMGAGRAEFLETDEEKAHALNCMLGHLAKTDEVFHFPAEQLKRTCVFRIRVEHPSGKHRA